MPNPLGKNNKLISPSFGVIALDRIDRQISFPDAVYKNLSRSFFVPGWSPFRYYPRRVESVLRRHLGGRLRIEKNKSHGVFFEFI